MSGSIEQHLCVLVEAGVEHIVVGASAAVILGAPLVTFDLDIVHRRTPENIDRLHELLVRLDAHHRFDLANRRLAPSRELLAGTGHLNLKTVHGDLDVLCELSEGEGYEELIADTERIETPLGSLQVLSLPRLIAVKKAVGRPKDLAALPTLLAAHEERERRKR